MQTPTHNPYQPPQASLLSHEQAPPMSMKDLLFSFEGRIPRRKYWLASAVMTGLVFIPVMIAMLMESTAAIVIVGVLCLPLIYVSFAVGTKRWHDRNKSGWWNLIGLIPYIGGIWAFIECGCLRGTLGSNSYGPDPT